MPAGSVNIMRYGAGPNGVMRTLGQYMLGSGATFGYADICWRDWRWLTLQRFFMSIGSTIRTDSTTQQAIEALARRKTYIMPRQKYTYPQHPPRRSA
jgi:hypothetical protein